MDKRTRIKVKEAEIGKAVLESNHRLQDTVRKQEVELRKLRSDKWDVEFYKKENEKHKKMIESFEDRSLELCQEKNKLKRELNRKEYNQYRTVAVVLSNEDNNPYWELDDKMRRFYREYAFLYWITK